MRKAAVVLFGLSIAVAAAEIIIAWQVHIDRGRLAAFLISLALLLTVFAGFSYTPFVKSLRQIAVQSAALAATMPFLLLIPYLIYALGTGIFSSEALGKLAAYVAVPTLCLFPDRHHRADRVGWRDFAAMLALAVPVGAGWLGGIWTWPEELYFFRPIFSVCIGAYAFLVLRNLDGVGYRLTFRKGDLIDGGANFAAFALIGIPLGLALGFIQFQPHGVSFWSLGFQLFAVYLTVAVPEEFLFRGVLQNFLVRSLRTEKRSLHGLLIASVIFGAAHLHHAPVPNWRYAILATLAGIFYGNAFRNRQRLSAAALTHALVDTVWHFWF
ncbi:MAG: CPBP family intramembrane metalloprotease [Acidobacteriia bacterium]|nr:CPBP family intramembrane metalloprotease [Terriglobia bacterium]